MLVLKAILTTVLSMILLFLMTKLTGDKQISQMSAFDYIVGITIGSSAAEMAIGGDVFVPAAVVTFLYGVVAFAISYICNKSVRARRFLNGEPLLLYSNGVFYKKNMAKVRMDMGEFLTQCRTAGYFSLESISSVIMESNGKVSFLAKGTDDLSVNVIIDGRMIVENLERIGKNEWWLMRQLDERQLKIRDIMLGTVDKGKVLFYTFNEKDVKNHLFE